MVEAPPHALLPCRMTTYRVTAQISVEGGPWEAYDTTIEGDEDLDALPRPDEIVPGIQHQVAAAKGTTAIAVRVREVAVEPAMDVEI
jgi:hypothetical protein